MEAQYRKDEYEKEKGMEKDRIKFWYKQADRILTFEISRIICEEDNRKQSIMSNDLVIGRDNGNGSFRASLHFN